MADKFTLYLATFDTRHFTFEGVARSEAAAIDVCKDALAQHGKQYGLPLEWWWADEPAPNDDDLFTVRKLEVGQAYRDGEVMPIRPEGEG